jgi:hypothetical protein
MVNLVGRQLNTWDTLWFVEAANQKTLSEIRV